MTARKPFFTAVVCILLALSLFSWPQATEVDQISGTVVESTGTFDAGAQVKATQTSTGFTRITTTNSSGFYGVLSLPIGANRIEVSAAGFKMSVQEVVLQVKVSPPLNSSLEVGSIQQQVAVEASASMAETHCLPGRQA